MFRNLKKRLRRNQAKRVAGSAYRVRGGIVDVLLAIVVFPIRVLFYPIETVFKWFYRPHVDANAVGRNRPQGFFRATWFWTKRIGREVLLIPLRIVQAPVAIFQSLAKRKRTDVLYVLPALAMIGFFGFVFFQVFARANTIDDRYKLGARTAMANNDFKRAKTYLSRIIGQGNASNVEQYQWLVILGQTGEVDRASQLLDQLAPDDGKGFAPAHRLKALNLAAQVSGATAGSNDPLTLRKLRSHLENCGENTNEVNAAWAIYYLAVDDTDKALSYLRSAAESNPSYLLTIADISQQQGRAEQQELALTKAEDAYRRLVEKDPLDVASRIALANILSRQRNLDEAEKMLLTGLKLQPDPVLRRQTAGFYLLRQQVAAAQGKSFAAQFELLQNAIALDRDYPPIYDRMQLMYGQFSDSTERAKVKESLLEAVTGDQPSSMAHFALSNVLWLEGDKEEAEAQLQQAYRLNPDFSIVINNLAWMLSQKEDPELERALELIESILVTAPNDPRFLDTYATVLMKQQRWDDAIVQFKKALPNTPATQEIHANLAICYERLGKVDFAKRHRDQATKDAQKK